MKVLVLGAHAASAQAARGASRSTLAISPDGAQWMLVNAAPAIGEQLRQHEAVLSDGAPIRAVVLTSAAIDASAGLLSMRDGPAIDLYATPRVFEDLTGALPLLSVLQHYREVRWHLLGIAGEQHSVAFQVDGLPGLRFEAFALPGLAPRYSQHRLDPAPGDRIALSVFDSGTQRRLGYAPGLASAEAMPSLHDADCLLLDAGAWPRAPAERRATLRELLQRSRARRKVLLHLRAGDPLLDESGRERQRLRARGIEVGHDGMEIEL